MSVSNCQERSKFWRTQRISTTLKSYPLSPSMTVPIRAISRLISLLLKFFVPSVATSKSNDSTPAFFSVTLRAPPRK